MTQILTFDQFRATKQFVRKDAAWCTARNLKLNGADVYEYAAGCFLFDSYTFDGGAHLIIGNVGWEAESPEELDEQLYNEVYLPLMGVAKSAEAVSA